MEKEYTLMRRMPVSNWPRLALPIFLLLAPSVSASTQPPSTPLALDFHITLGPASVGDDWYQMAIWLEDSEGHYIDTLYVTDAVGKEGLGNDYMTFLGITLRKSPESLPVWAHKRNVKYGDSYYPPKAKPLPDAITGATVKAQDVLKSFAIAPNVLARLKDNRLTCCVEINVSRDGVPSMVFGGSIPMAATVPVPLSFLGYGAEKGENGSIAKRDDLKVEPTAYVKEATVSFATAPNAAPAR